MLKSILYNETFLEMYYDNAICFKYVACNAKVSLRVVDTLRSEVPEYLHGRPHWFVRHCISRLRNTAEMDPGAVTQMTADAFQVTRRINRVNVQVIPRI